MTKEDEEYKLQNYTEVLVLQTLKEMLEETEGICKCRQCQMEIASFALNQLQPMYITSRKGEIYSRLEEFKVQVKADIITSLVKAIEIVKKNPRHR